MRRSKIIIAVAIIAAVSLILVGLALSGAFSPKETRMVLTTTTSTQNSGLLDYILPTYESKYDIRVDVVAVGSGQALDIAKKCNADVVLSHAPSLETPFVHDRYGLFRWQVMYNQFAIVGPSSDPAGVASATNASSAFRKIADNSSTFLSRADNSGTNVKELAIWASTGLDPDTFGAWYKKVGKGMEETLQMATELQAYTLTDEATYFAIMPTISVVELFRSDTVLFNQYSVIPVNPDKCPNADIRHAALFAEWLVSPATLDLIASYQRNGHQLFYPNAIPP